MKLSHFCVDDLDVLYRLEAESSAHPWSKEHIRSSLASSHMCLGLKENHQWVCYSIWRLLGPEAELLLLGTPTAYRRNGFASQLVSQFLLENPGVEQIHLEVRAGNQAARHFYEDFGFIETCTRRAYYRRPVEDASLYVYEVNR